MPESRGEEAEEMGTLKRKLDQKRRELDDLTVEMTMNRKQMVDAARFDRAKKLENSLELLAVANHNMFMAAVALGEL